MSVDPKDNPYRRPARRRPPSFVGRNAELERIRFAVGVSLTGRAPQSVCFYGLRGVGKTVLLRRAADEAAAMGALTVCFEARRSASLPGLLLPALRQALVQWRVQKNGGAAAEQALARLRRFVDAVRVRYSDVDVPLDGLPAPDIVESGCWRQDLCELLSAVGEGVKAAKTSLVILIDEMQRLSNAALEGFVESLHRLGQKNLPIVLISAGLPDILSKAVNAKPYAERLIEFAELGPLTEDKAEALLAEPAMERGVVFEKGASNFVVQAAGGYPELIAVWGRTVWSCAEEGALTITLAVARKAAELAQAALEADFYRPKIDQLTPKEKAFLFAMSEFESPSVLLSDIAAKLKMKTASMIALRTSLVRKGLLYTPRPGEAAYTIPLYAGYLRSIRARGPL